MTEVALFIFLALIPGFVSVIIILNNIVHKKIEVIYFFIYSSILGLSSYLILGTFRKIFILISNYINKSSHDTNDLSIWSLLSIDNKQWKIQIHEVAWASVIGIFLGIILVALIHHKILNRFLRFFRLTTKYGDESLFYYFLNSKDIDWIYIRDCENDRIIQGRVQSFSEYGKYQEVLLYNVRVFNNERNSELLYSVPNMYLCFEYGRFQIEKIPDEMFE